MTTDVIVRTNGNYVAEVKIDGEDKGGVGPGTLVQRQFFIPHGGKHVVEIEERSATAEEIESASAPKPAA